MSAELSNSNRNTSSTPFLRPRRPMLETLRPLRRCDPCGSSGKLCFLSNSSSQNCHRCAEKGLSCVWPNPVVRTCTTCQNRKRHCDAAQPICSWCLQTKSPCKYRERKPRVQALTKTNPRRPRSSTIRVRRVLLPRQTDSSAQSVKKPIDCQSAEYS